VSTGTELLALAARLSGSAVAAVFATRPGGNNRVFRVETGHGSFALKMYPHPDERDRLGHEFGGLCFLRGRGEAAIAAPIASDPAVPAALYEWIDGAPVTPDEGSIAAMLGFAERLNVAAGDAAAATLPEAVEAVRSRDDLTAQIAARLARLRAPADGDSGLAGFLTGRFVPQWERLRALAADGQAAAAATLSPSDFGTHNMLRRPDGTYAFVDFEYFGWDDPVKLVADVLWHPAMDLDPNQARQFLGGAADIYRDDASFADRLRERYPLFGLRWALIVLNEFVPEIWERRLLAGASPDWPAAKAIQLAKAERFTARAAAGLDPLWPS
jgi:Ser/Thr protein kinase RdoA (MazF antagonist)